MMISDTPFPIPLSVIFSPSHITNIVPAISTIVALTVNNAPEPNTKSIKGCSVPCKLARIGRSLQQQHDNGQVANSLVDFAAAALPFFLQFLEVGNYDSEQLDYDRSRDIGHNSERENRGVAECSSGEDIQQPQQSVAIHLTLKVVQSSRIDTGITTKLPKRYTRSKESVKEDSLAQLFDLEYILDGLD